MRLHNGVVVKKCEYPFVLHTERGIISWNTEAGGHFSTVLVRPDLKYRTQFEAPSTRMMVTNWREFRADEQ